jgi:MoaA/NifB/PqqE/SkfB family radical SAM enzyme
MSDKPKPINMVYALSWGCFCGCPICHSGFDGSTGKVSNIELWKKNTSRLVDYEGSVRITISGGDPMIYWTNENDELFQFIKYLHEKQVHVCVNTTGFKLSKEKLQKLDGYIDTILLSIRGLSVNEIMDEFCIEEKLAEELLENQVMILNEIKKTNIRLEVSTVVTKLNINRIKDLGWKLISINPNIIWRVEEYYRNGRQNYNTEINKYDLDAAVYDSLMIEIYQEFSNKVKMIRHSSKESRIKAPDVMLFPDGILHYSNDHAYIKSESIDKYNLETIKTRRNWASYLKTLRDWNWEKDKYSYYEIEKWNV